MVNLESREMSHAYIGGAFGIWLNYAIAIVESLWGDGVTVEEAGDGGLSVWPGRV